MNDPRTTDQPATGTARDHQLRARIERVPAGGVTVHHYRVADNVDQPVADALARRADGTPHH